MAVTYSNATKTAMATAVINAIDGGPAAGTIEICTAAYATVLATLTFSDPCGTQSNGLITFSGFPKSAVAGATGTAALARVKDSTGTVIFDGLTVGTAATDVVLGTTAITSGNTVQLNSATLQVQ
jgi:hypothetical protein